MKMIRRSLLSKTLGLKERDNHSPRMPRRHHASEESELANRRIVLEFAGSARSTQAAYFSATVNQMSSMAMVSRKEWMAVNGSPVGLPSASTR